MATTDQRSGFRLPWSSDRAHDSQPAEEAAPSADAPAEEILDENVVWPESDLNKRLGLTSQPRPAEPGDTTTATTAPTGPDAEEPAMLDQETAIAPARAVAAPRKPSKLMADLSAAIRATAESARDQALTQVDADVAQIVEAIRAGSKEGENALRKQSDEDIIAIKDWSRAEIARIKEETDGKIDTRKSTLTAELTAHAAAIEARVGEVVGTADSYRAEMSAYASRLEDEDDPSLLATMAESLPEAPSLEALADLGNLAWAIPVADELDEPQVEVEAVAEAIAEPVVEEAPEAEATVEAEAVAEPVVAFEDGDGSDGSEDEVAIALAAAATAEVEAIPETVEVEAIAAEVEPTVPEPETGSMEPAAIAESQTSDPSTSWGEPAADAAGPWGDEGTSWHADGTATAVATDDDTPRWAAGETPDGFPTNDEAGDPVDRGAIMAALEAAAEAVVAAESAAESAGQAEAAADVAETAAELLKGRVGDEEYDPEAHAAMAARVDAGGVEESYTDRLAKLLPSHPEGDGSTEPRTTQVVVSGLVSVASIASFKRHVGRIGGVQNVAVASGPDGEFVFNVTHLPDVSFRDALPTIPGFAARVTAAADGSVHVAARDPEAEG